MKTKFIVLICLGICLMGFLIGFALGSFGGYTGGYNTGYNEASTTWCNLVNQEGDLINDLIGYLQDYDPTWDDMALFEKVECDFE